MVSVVRCWKAEYQKCKHLSLIHISHQEPLYRPHLYPAGSGQARALRASQAECPAHRY